MVDKAWMVVHCLPFHPLELYPSHPSLCRQWCHPLQFRADQGGLGDPAVPLSRGDPPPGLPSHPGDGKIKKRRSINDRRQILHFFSQVNFSTTNLELVSSEDDAKIPPHSPPPLFQTHLQELRLTNILPRKMIWFVVMQNCAVYSIGEH